MTATVLKFPPRFEATGELYEPWIDQHELARHFSVSDRTVRRWREQGMPAAAIGASWRYRRSQCERWHEERR